jgi:hypothetical protein
MIKSKLAYAVQLWPVVQVWTGADDGIWRRSPEREQSLIWLDYLRCSWGQSFAIERFPDGCCVEEGGQLLFLGPTAARCRLWWNRYHSGKLIAAIPTDVWEILESANVWRDEAATIRLLKFFQTGPEAIQLYRGNQGVGYLLANARSFKRKLQAEDIRRMVFWPQRKILGALGFPATELMRQIVRNLTFWELSNDVLKQVRRLCHSRATADLLQQVRSIDCDVIGLLDQTEHPYRELLSPGFIRSYAEAGREERGKFAVQDLWLLSEAAELGFWKKRPLLSLRHYHKQVDKVLKSLGSTSAPLPAPPTEGDHSIAPLRSASEIIAEGREQQHCLGRTWHLLRVFNGESYFYRVLQPRRGTLELCYGSSGFWQIRQFRWTANEQPTEEETGAMDCRLQELMGENYKSMIELRREQTTRLA